MTRTILIVSSDGDIRVELKDLLEEHYRIIESGSAKDALLVLKSDYARISALIVDIKLPYMDGFELVRKIRAQAFYLSTPIVLVSEEFSREIGRQAVKVGANGLLSKPWDSVLLYDCLRNIISMRENASLSNWMNKDRLTKLLNYDAFFDECDKRIRENEPGYYQMSCFNVDNFKVINDQYGMEIGDKVLKYIANCIMDSLDKIEGIACRYTADRFAALYPAQFSDSEEIRKIHDAMLTPPCMDRPIRIRIGRCIIEDCSVSANVLYDHAMIAEESIKGRYDVFIAKYDNSMREQIIREQQIVNAMNDALEKEQFVPFLQPQYNHATGALIGAEALVRWKTEEGFISPGEFIPIFERNGFIYELDKYMWEQVCKLLYCWKSDEKFEKVLPISVNISRLDLYRNDFFEVITGLIEKYQIEPELLRLEVTESAFTNSPKQILSMVKQLNDFGFTVEIDDFGSGYSSLNTLKDVPAEILKLDMRFFENTENSERGGNIIESVVRMAKWLGMAVIAEGVEEREQADYLKSIGCYYIQGFYYAKPMPIADYEKLLHTECKEPKLTRLVALSSLNNNEFWNPKSMETLIFNSYVGGACIFEYHFGVTELLRVNDQYAQALGSLVPLESRLLELNPIIFMDDDNKKLLYTTLHGAIQSEREAKCELVLRDTRDGVALEEWVQYTMRVIASTGERYLFYCVLQNMTKQRVEERLRRDAEHKEMESAQQLQVIMSNINGGVSAILIDDDGKSTFVSNNERYYCLYGYSKEEAIREKLDVMTLILPEDFPSVMKKVKKLKKTKKPIVIDYRCKKKDGTIVYLRANASMMHIDGYEDDVITSVVTDITEQKQLSDQLQAIIENINGGVAATNYQNDSLHFLLVNRRFYEILGYTEEDYQEENPDVFDFLHPEDHDETVRKFIEYSKNSEAFSLNYRIVRKDGEVRWIQSNVNTMKIFGVDGDVQLSVLNDVTMLHIAEEHEHQTAEKWMAVMNHVGNGIVAIAMFEDHKEFVFANDCYYDMLGYTKEEYHQLIEPNIYTVVHPEDRERVSQEVERCTRLRQDNSITFRIVRPDRAVRWLQSTITVTHLAGIVAPVQIAVFSDITEEKEANEQLRFLNDSAHDILAQSDTNGAIDELLRKLQQFFQSDRSYIFEYDKKRMVENNTYEYCASGVESEKEWLQDIPFNTTSRWYPILNNNQLVSIPCVDEIDEKERGLREILKQQKIESLIVAPLMRDGELIGYLGLDNPRLTVKKNGRLRAIGDYIAILLTRRDLMTAVREQEKKRIELLDYLPCGAALYEYDGKKIKAIHINKRYWKLVERDKLLYGNDAIMDAVHPDDRRIISRAITTCIQKNNDCVCDVRIRCGQTGYQPFHLAALARPSENGKYVFYVTYTRITDQMISSQEMLPMALSTMMAVSEDLSFMKDRDLRYICYSQSGVQMLGLSSEQEIIGKNDYEIFDKEQAEKFLEVDHQILRTGKPKLNYIVKHQIKNGHYRVANTSKYPVLDATGKVIGIYGISHDITEVREKESQLQLLTSSIPGGLASFSIEGDKIQTIFFNDGFYRFSGYTREEYLKMTEENPLALMFSEDRKKILAKMHSMYDALEDNVVNKHTYRCHTKNGGCRWMSMKYKLSKMSETKYILNVVQLDITEEKETEEKLRMAKEVYRIAAQQSGRTITQYDVVNHTLTLTPDNAKRLSMPEVIEDIPYTQIRAGVISEDTQEAYIAFFEKITRGEKDVDVMFQKLLPSGWRWLSAHSTTIYNPDGEPIYAVISFQDVTEENEREAIYKKWQQSLEERPDDSYTLYRCAFSQNAELDSVEGSLLTFEVKPGVTESFDERAARYASRHVYPDDRETYKKIICEDKLIANYYRGIRSDSFEFRELMTQFPELIEDVDDVEQTGVKVEYRWIRCSVDLVERPDSQGLLVYLMYENIDESKRLELSTRTQAELDPLTGLLNRKTFTDKLNQVIVDSRGHSLCAVFLLDVDDFKSINDTHGHAVGDDVLVEVGRVLQSTVREYDLVGRLGGDEFLVALCNAPNREVIRKKAGKICSLMHKTFYNDIQLSISLGIAVSPSDGKDFETLYEKADKALYEVKEKGKDNFAFYLEKFEE